MPGSSRSLLHFHIPAILSAGGTYFVIPRDLYPPIEQGAVIVSKTNQRAAAHELLDFLLSAPVQSEFAKSGLTPVK